jgi:hypothetical protein
MRSVRASGAMVAAMMARASSTGIVLVNGRIFVPVNTPSQPATSNQQLTRYLLI